MTTHRLENYCPIAPICGDYFLVVKHNITYSLLLIAPLNPNEGSYY